MATLKRSTDGLTCRERQIVIQYVVYWSTSWLVCHQCWTYILVLQDQFEDLFPLSHTLSHTEWHHIALIQSTVTWYLMFYCEVVTSGVCVHTGWLMWNLVGILLRMAESKSWGRLVAPIMITWQTDSSNIQIINVNKTVCVCLYLCTCRCVSVSSPSHRLMNWAFIMAVASWSELDRLLRNESVYIITGTSHQSRLINETVRNLKKKRFLTQTVYEGLQHYVKLRRVWRERVE